MRRIIAFLACWGMCITGATAAVRSGNSTSRTATTPTVTRTTSDTTSRTATTTSSVSRAATTTPVTSSRTATSTPNIVSRTASAPTVSTRPTTSSASRAAVANAIAAPRIATTGNTARVSRAAARSATTTSSVSRAATTPTSAARSARSATTGNTARISRAATNVDATSTNTFGTGYNACRDAYFTCMDQFCAKQNETYRRCVCSARLEDVKNHERVLSQTATQLEDFKGLNIAVITKTAAEVKAMLSDTAGEAAAADAKDKSASATALAGISDVLNKTKEQSLSTQGQLDIAGDISAIWATTDFASGAELANLTGEALYNAVHAQCADLVSASCDSTATFNMVVSAYGMYIENDCTTLANALDKKTTAASGDVRATEREMNQARLENYNAHNSSSINDCIASVRSDITNDMACGEDYVHCLDITGLYLNRDSGEPIYSTDFYQLGSQLSLAGDVLTNETNLLLVSELQRKKTFAEKSLDSCRDVADDVWDEFLRQAITEIYQGQQARVRQVKDECLSVVNQCYDEQNKQLKDFSNVKEQLLLGSRLELSEEMCREKLSTCSNLYGGGVGGEMMLVSAMMSGITDQKIAKDCQTTLVEFAQELCAVPNNDNLHNYPYACRTYAPGEQRIATIAGCNSILSSENYIDPSQIGTDADNPYITPVQRKYTTCNSGYYLAYDKAVNGEYDETGNGTFTDNNNKSYPQPDPEPKAGNFCFPCPGNCICPGGTAAWTGGDTCTTGTSTRGKCGSASLYLGSLYQKLVRYALQVCIRPSYTETGNDVLPTIVLEDVNVVMNQIKTAMSTELATECERLGGTWVNLPYDETNSSSKKLFDLFYTETGANTSWGYCAQKDSGDGT